MYHNGQHVTGCCKTVAKEGNVVGSDSRRLSQFPIYLLSASLHYRKFSQNGCLFLRGAYFHGVLINTCNILAARSCVGMD